MLKTKISISIFILFLLCSACKPQIHPYYVAELRRNSADVMSDHDKTERAIGKIRGNNQQLRGIVDSLEVTTRSAESASERCAAEGARFSGN